MLLSSLISLILFSLSRINLIVSGFFLFSFRFVVDRVIPAPKFIESISRVSITSSLSRIASTNGWELIDPEFLIVRLKSMYLPDFDAVKLSKESSGRLFSEYSLFSSWIID